MKYTNDLVFPKYHEFELRQLLPTIKISMAVAILFILIFAYLDIIQNPDFIKTIITLRIIICIPLIVVFIVMNSHNIKFKLATIMLPFAYLSLFVYIYLHTQIPGKIYFFNLALMYSLLIVISVASLYSRLQVAIALIISMLISFAIMYFFSSGNEDFIIKMFIRSLGPLTFTFVLACAIQNNHQKNYIFAKTIHKQTLYDPITQIYNRRGLDVWLSHKVEPREDFSKSITLVMLDLDDFKKLNDNYGHQTGDIILEGTSKLLLKNTQNNSCIVRFGGDEFMVILLGMTHEKSIEYAKNIKTIIGQYIYNISPNKPFNVTVSVGIVHTNKKDQSIENLISIADGYSYKAKLDGKNKVVWE